jgi:hypothetical protein
MRNGLPWRRVAGSGRPVGRLDAAGPGPRVLGPGDQAVPAAAMAGVPVRPPLEDCYHEPTP